MTFSVLRISVQNPIPEQGDWVRSVVEGHFNYFAVPNNNKAIETFRAEVIKIWRKALRRRSNKARKQNWSRFERLIKTWVPKKEVRHPYPSQRLRVTYPR